MAGQLYVYTQGSPADIQTPAHWNLIGRSMNAPPPVLSPTSILPPVLSPFSYVNTKPEDRVTVEQPLYLTCRNYRPNKLTAKLLSLILV